MKWEESVYVETRRFLKGGERRRVVSDRDHVLAKVSEQTLECVHRDSIDKKSGDAVGDDWKRGSTHREKSAHTI